MKCKICAGIDDTSIICEDCGETFYMCELDNPKDKCGLVEKSEAKAKELEAQLATLEAKVRAEILKALPKRKPAVFFIEDSIFNEAIALCEKAVKGGAD
jgi:hypothetical protein